MYSHDSTEVSRRSEILRGEYRNALAVTGGDTTAAALLCLSQSIDRLGRRLESALETDRSEPARTYLGR